MINFYSSGQKDSGLCFKNRVNDRDVLQAQNGLQSFLGVTERSCSNSTHADMNE